MFFSHKKSASASSNQHQPQPTNMPFDWTAIRSDDLLPSVIRRHDKKEKKISCHQFSVTNNFVGRVSHWNVKNFHINFFEQKNIATPVANIFLRFPYELDPSLYKIESTYFKIDRDHVVSSSIEMLLATERISSGLFAWRNSREIWMVWRNAGGICERKTLLRMKK